MAVACDDVKAAGLLLEQGAAVDATAGEYANTPLMQAAMYGYREMAILLIRKGAALDLVDTRGDTALHWAILAHKPRLAELLIKEGARVHVPDNEHDTPFDLAVHSKQQSIIELIAKRPGPKEELAAIKAREEAAAAAAEEARAAAERARIQSLADMRQRLHVRAPRVKPAPGGM